MGWIITRDYLTEKNICGPSDVGTGAGTISEPHESFALYDDDGELYYRGKASADGGMSMANAQDWAEANAGVTTCKYRDRKTGKWRML
jgi:hypothetical protein